MISEPHDWKGVEVCHLKPSVIFQNRFRKFYFFALANQSAQSRLVVQANVVPDEASIEREPATFLLPKHDI